MQNRGGIAIILSDCHPTFNCRLDPQGWAHAASVSFGFRVASERRGNYGSKRWAFSAGSIDFLVEGRRSLENDHCRDNRRKRDAAGEKQPIRGLEPEQ